MRLISFNTKNYIGWNLSYILRQKWQKLIHTKSSTLQYLLFRNLSLKKYRISSNRPHKDYSFQVFQVLHILYKGKTILFTKLKYSLPKFDKCKLCAWFIQGHKLYLNSNSCLPNIDYKCYAYYVSIYLRRRQTMVKDIRKTSLIN